MEKNYVRYECSSPSAAAWAITKLCVGTNMRLLSVHKVVCGTNMRLLSVHKAVCGTNMGLLSVHKAVCETNMRLLRTCSTPLASGEFSFVSWRWDCSPMRWCQGRESSTSRVKPHREVKVVGSDEEQGSGLRISALYTWRISSSRCLRRPMTQTSNVENVIKSTAHFHEMLHEMTGNWRRVKCDKKQYL